MKQLKKEFEDYNSEEGKSWLGDQGSNLGSQLQKLASYR